MSTCLVLVRKDSYQDSVLLMRISREVKSLQGVEDAVVAMGTPNNRELLTSSGYASPALDAAGPNDLIIAVRSTTVGQVAIEQSVDRLLKGKVAVATEQRPATLAGAIAEHPEANLVLISLPGEHAAREARRALSLGRHVMLFSDNVSVEDEVSLKKEAAQKGLLMMGPDCGTAILNGMPLAFANVVRRGPIGIVGAAGTGIQEVSSCIDRLGGGVSQAVGTGGRDLSEAVGGTMMLLGIEALAADQATTVLVIVSKPPSEVVAEKVVAAAVRAGKPTVIHFVGGVAAVGQPARERPLRRQPGRGRRGRVPPFGHRRCEGGRRDDRRGTDHRAARAPGPAVAACEACSAAGTTGHEALVLLTRAGLEVRSNLHKKGVAARSTVRRSSRATCCSTSATTVHAGPAPPDDRAGAAQRAARGGDGRPGGRCAPVRRRPRPRVARRSGGCTRAVGSVRPGGADRTSSRSLP